MYLTAQNLAEIFSQTKGFIDDELLFITIASGGTDAQPSGLFIPLWGNHEDLFAAIHRGAVAAIWEEGRPVPAYTPNLFPIFYTKNIWKDVHLLMDNYLKKLGQEDEVKIMSNILFLTDSQNENLKFKNEEMQKSWSALVKEYKEVRRG